MLDSTKEYERVWSKIKSEIKRINGGEKVFYEKNYCKIDINTKDDLLLKESLKILTLIVNINLVLQTDNKYTHKFIQMNAFMSYKSSTKNLTLNENDNHNDNDDDDNNDNDDDNENENEEKKIFLIMHENELLSI